jgi:hypothetical protein
MPDNSYRQKTKSLKEAWLNTYVKNAPCVGITNEKVCISYTTYASWLKDDCNFAAAVSAIDRSLVELAEKKLVEAVQSGQPWAIKYFLENRAPERWQRHQAEPALFKFGETSGKLTVEWVENGKAENKK